MSILEFLPTNKTLESDFFDLLINPTMNVPNTLFKDPTQLEDLFEIEYKPGMSLNSLANEYLGDSYAWQIIADANNIDPSSPIELGTNLKVPTREQLQASITKIIVDSPGGKQIISSVEESILNLAGLGESNSDFSKNLRECINKIVDFRIST